MARIRSIKPEFFLDEELAALPPLTRLLFVGLWTQAERPGRLKDKAVRIKATILPYDDCDIDAMLDELQAAGFIVRYTVHEHYCIAIRNFDNHQVFNNERESKLPPPPADSFSLLEDYGSDTVAVIHGRGRVGREGEGAARAGAREATPPPSAVDNPSPTPPRRANGLPPCFDQDITYRGQDPVPIANVIRDWQQQAFGMQSPADIGVFDAVVTDCCLSGCDGCETQAWECMDVIEKAIDRCGDTFKPRLIGRIISEDRRDLCQTSKRR